MQPTYEEGRTLTDGRKLDSDGKVVAAPAEPVVETPAQSDGNAMSFDGNNIEEEKKEEQENAAEAGAPLTANDVMNKFSSGLSSIFGFAKQKANQL